MRGAVLAVLILLVLAPAASAAYVAPRAWLWPSQELCHTYSFGAGGSGGSEPAAWHFDFGDGTRLEVQGQEYPAFRHVFPADGAYNVTATVTDSMGASNSTTKTLLAGEAGCIPEPHRSATLAVKSVSISGDDALPCPGRMHVGVKVSVDLTPAPASPRQVLVSVEMGPGVNVTQAYIPPNPATFKIWPTATVGAHHVTAIRVVESAVNEDTTLVGGRDFNATFALGPPKGCSSAVPFRSEASASPSKDAQGTPAALVAGMLLAVALGRRR